MNFSKWMFYASGGILTIAAVAAALRDLGPDSGNRLAARPIPEAATGARNDGSGATAPARTESLADAFGFDSPAEIEVAQKLRVTFTTGAYAKALTTIDELLAKRDISPAFRGWLQAQLPVVLASDGWASIGTGDCERAIESLRRAALLAKSAEAAPQMLADIHRGLGFCLKKNGQPGGAEENLLEAVRVNPRDEESRFLLADVYESDGRFSDAVRILEDGNPSPELAKRVEVMRRRAGEGDLQQTQRTQHFSISYRQGQHEGLVAQAAQILESSLDEFVEKYGYREPSTPIEVILYPTGRFSWALGGVPDWAEGIFDGRMRIPVKRAQPGDGPSSPLIVQVLRHELVHALNANMTGGRALPPWLEEGLAQRIGEMPYGASFPFPVKPGPFAPAGDFASSYMSFGAAAAGSIYGQSLYLMLTLENLEPDALRRVISALSSHGGTSADMILSPIGLTFDRLYQVAAIWWKERRELAAR